jgi:hypothetical protein
MVDNRDGGDHSVAAAREQTEALRDGGVIFCFGENPASASHNGVRSEDELRRIARVRNTRFLGRNAERVRSWQFVLERRFVDIRRRDTRGHYADLLE